MTSPPATPKERATDPTGRKFRYYDYFMAAFVTVLLCSNIIGAAKPSEITLFDREFIFGTGILFFPISYIIGDILTEVYGYAAARRVIWAGFAAAIFASFMSFAVVTLPPAEGWDGQEAYEYVYGQVPRIFAASIIAFWAGEFANAYTLSKMKLWTKGKFLWARTIGSTAVGQGVDSLLFYPLAFLGVWTTEQVIAVMLLNYVLKVGWEALLTPVTYVVIARAKRAENLDAFDTKTNFTPFSVER